MRRLVAVIAVLLAGCSGDEGPVVRVAAGPVLAVNEGELAQTQVTIEPRPVAPIAAASLRVEIDPDFVAAAADRFEVLRVRDDAVLGPVLEVLPRCDMVRGLQLVALVPVRVSAEPANLAAPADVLVRVASRDGADCAPRVTIWSGDCATPPATTPAALELTPSVTPDPLCVRVESQDPDGEILAVSLTSTIPTTVLAALPAPAGGSSQTIELALASTLDVRGDFRLEWEVARAGAESVAGGADVAIGLPGSMAIEVVDPIPAGEPVHEFDVGSIGVRIWRRADDSVPARRLCTGAVRKTDLPPFMVPRNKDYLLLRAGTSDPVAEGAWLCGTESPLDVRITVSPPIDAAVTERILVEARACDAVADCPQPVDTPMPPPQDVAFIDVPVTSVAEELPCLGGAMPTSAIVTCADLLDDGTPEVVARSRDGQYCAYRMAEGRLTEVVPWDPATIPPVWIRAFPWQGPLGVENVVLAQLPPGPGERMKRLVIADAGMGLGYRASWQSAAPLLATTVVVPLQRAEAVGAGAGAAATHLFSPITPPVPGAPWMIDVRCLSAPTVTGCVDSTFAVGTAIPNNAQPMGMGQGDLDGDGDQDVLLYLLEPQPPPIDVYIHVIAIELDWTLAGPNPTSMAETDGVFQTGGNQVKSASGAGDVTDEFDNVYITATGQFEARLWVVRGSAGIFASPLTLALIAAPGAMLAVAGVNGRLLGSSPTGLWELDDSVPMSEIWWLRDPVTLEALSAGELDPSNPSYGTSLAGCLGGSNDSAAFVSTGSNFRITELDFTLGTL